VDGVADYVLMVVVIPAAIAVLLASTLLVFASFSDARPQRKWCIEAIGFAVCVAFLLSFVRELEWSAIVRQVRVIEGDDAPFERWHRVGLLALVLAIAAFPMAWLHASAARLRPGLERIWFGAFALTASMLVMLFVAFPGANPWTQCGQGLLVLASIAAFARCAHGAVLWMAWIVFAALALLAGLGGFASLAVMCGAASAAAFGIAILAAIVGLRVHSAFNFISGGAMAVVLGTLVATVARCGMAYDQAGVPWWAWTAIPILPVGGSLFVRQARRAPFRAADTLWRCAGMLVLAAALAGAVAVSQASASEQSDESDQDLSDMYGG